MKFSWTKTKKFFSLFKKAFQELGQHDPLVLASSTAFFTMFSLAPIIVILINVLSLYFKQETISDPVFQQIRATFGENTAEQVNTFVNNFRGMASNTWITIGSTIFLTFIATNLFKVIKLSINKIWKIKKESTKDVLYTLKQRSKSVGIIFFTGLLFLLSTLSDTIISALDEFIGPALMNMDALFIVIVSKVVSFAFVTLWFAVLFRFLPDAKIQWSAIFVGAAVTTVLFTAGKYGLETFLINSNINNIFETSTSIVLILLYIFYSSMIIYFGAAFTKVYAEAFEAGIKTRKYATRIGEAYN